MWRAPATVTTPQGSTRVREQALKGGCPPDHLFRAHKNRWCIQLWSNSRLLGTCGVVVSLYQAVLTSRQKRLTISRAVSLTSLMEKMHVLGAQALENEAG